ncbi:MAG: FMN-binding protein [Candidatus Izimaplasma sp.]|nr:FMN-binding protein [Candidatus Izimaplasma bacterium]
MNNGLKSGLVLLMFGLICGLLLAVVNGLTADKIAAEELRLKTQAIEEYYSPDEYFIDIEEFDYGKIDSIFIIKESADSEEILALAYSVSSQGYGGLINVLVVVKNDLTIQDYKVISHTESGPGSGVTDYEFLSKDSPANSLDDFDQMAGATFTSNAMRDIFSIIAERVENDMGGEVDD